MRRRDFMKLVGLGGVSVLAPGRAKSGFARQTAFADTPGSSLKEAMSVKQYRKVIVLGMDGMDPRVSREMIAAGHLPSFTRLAAEGTFTSLATCLPAQSPVAWATLATGVNPGTHGIFDFLRRRPEDYLIELALFKPNPRNITGSGKNMFLPVMEPMPFWEVIAEAGMPATVLKWPMTFPPRKSDARVLAGMGVPDIRGGLGTYTFFTDVPPGKDEKALHKVTVVTLNDSVAETSIEGPNVARLGKSKPATVALRIRIDRAGSRAVVQAQDSELAVRVGEFSPWLRLTFPAGLLSTVKGMCRFYLESLTPHLKLYLSPVQVDPREPCFPISEPEEYSAQLAETTGDFHTLGMPEDTKALTEGRLDERGFLQMCDDILAEQERMFDVELRNFDRGALATIFFTPDRVQHIFWVTRDPGHPMYERGYATQHAAVISELYRRMDRLLGKVLEAKDGKTAVLVCSDHGFTSFRNSVNLNSWLVENGFMRLKTALPPDDQEGGPLFRYVDWDNTRAYAFGFGGIYLNLAGREGRGTVKPGGEAAALARTIADRLPSLTDGDNRTVVRAVYLRDKVYSGTHVDLAPEVTVGFASGYRSSWQSALGGVQSRVIEPNMEKWTGDHLVDPSEVPRVLFTSYKRSTDLTPCLVDLAPSVLALLGLPTIETMEGKPLL